MNDITYIPKFFDSGEATLLYEHLLDKVKWHTPVNSEGIAAKGKRKMAYIAIKPAKKGNNSFARQNR